MFILQIPIDKDPNNVMPRIKPKDSNHPSPKPRDDITTKSKDNFSPSKQKTKDGDGPPPTPTDVMPRMLFPDGTDKPIPIFKKPTDNPWAPTMTTIEIEKEVTKRGLTRKNTHVGKTMATVLGNNTAYNKDGSYSRPGDTGKYYYQADGSIFYSGGHLAPPKGQIVPQTPKTLRNPNDPNTKWDELPDAQIALPSTFDLNRLDLVSNGQGAFIRPDQETNSGRYFLQIDGSIYFEGGTINGKKIGPQTYHNQTWQPGGAEPLPTTMGIAKIGLVPGQKGSLFKPGYSGNWEALEQNDIKWSGGKNIKTGEEIPTLVYKKDKDYKAFTEIDGNLFSVTTKTVNGKEIYFYEDGNITKGVFISGKWETSQKTISIALLGLTKNNDGSYSLPGSTNKCYVLSDGKVYQANGNIYCDGKWCDLWTVNLTDAIINELTNTFGGREKIIKLLAYKQGKPKPKINFDDARRNITLLNSKICMKHNPNSPFLHGNGMSYTPKTDFSLLSSPFDKPRIPEDPDTTNFEFLSNKDLLKKVIFLTSSPDNVEKYLGMYKEGVDPFYLELEQFRKFLQNPK